MTTTEGPSGSALVRKLAEVMAAVGRVPKHGWNDFHKYHFATEADVLEAVRTLLAERQVVLLPAIVGMHRDAVGEKGQVITTLEMEFTFLDAESGERETRAWLGQGADKEDKGAYKAMTGGTKNFILKTFLIPTGDDPELDEKAEPATVVVREPNDEQPPHPAEMDDGPPHPANLAAAPVAKPKPVTKPAAGPRPVPAGAFRVASVSDPIEGTSAQGPWKRWIVEFEKGPKLSTFSDTVAEVATDACARRLPVVPTIFGTGTKSKLTALEVAD